MYHFSGSFSISTADIVVVAAPTQNSERYRDSKYVLSRLEYPDIRIPNRSAAWCLAAKDENDPQIRKLQADIRSYNAYLDYIESIPGFFPFFMQNHMCVTKKEVEEKWGEEIASEIFSLPHYIFTTQLNVVDKCLLDETIPAIYSVSIDGKNLFIPLGKSANDYPNTYNGSDIIWNWVDSGHDFCFFLWQALGSRYSKNDLVQDDDDDTVNYWLFDAYDQVRDGPAEPQLIRIFHLLEHEGYISAYTIKPVRDDPRWQWFGKTDGSIDVAFLDSGFKSDNSITEKIETLLWAESCRLID